MRKIAYLLKSSQLLYDVYFYCMSGLLRFLGLFCRTDDQLILFNSYGGKKYDDSPKAIYEAMIADERFREYKLIWALQDPESMNLPADMKVVKADTLEYFRTALKAKVWVTNSSIERGLSFKKKETLCFNTWHGTAIKVMGKDISAENQSFRSKVIVRADIMLAQSQYDIDVFSRAFELPLSAFRLIGLPRNDELANYTTEKRNEIRKRLNIPKDKKVLLYAPTFREYTKGSSHEVVLKVPMDLKYWQQTLGDEFIVLFRAHYEVAKHMEVSQFELFRDVSAYPKLNELMIAADALISDYSSIYFDFSVMGKPMFCFAYDYEEYMSNRGMYIDLSKELPCRIHRDECDLLKDIRNYVFTEKEDEETVQFRDRFVSKYGHAAKNSCDIIINETCAE